ncbi:hypothetical protein [Sphingomonas sp. TREG-RG-20F-R18-01]|uniref:hypothetical protein n=1 Tax=Sphingomonas sp. TREG-RG-20F-R18-01 TaxID=2914982 RepID=UPI001F5A5212|nr:hypothetical protein [Sphingomonas sp. TREG-RG-20F-R18-01]
MAFALDHVQIAIPPGSETEAPGFYGTRLGLRELDRPAILAGGAGAGTISVSTSSISARTRISIPHARRTSR